MKNRIKELRVERSWSQEHLANLIGTTNQQIGNLERGDRRLSDVWMEKLCRAFEIDPGDLFISPSGIGFEEGETDYKPQNSIWGVGDVNAGAFREALEWPESDWIPVPYISDDDRWPNAERRALLVRGDSMNERYDPETWIVFVDYFDLERSPESGERVIALQPNVVGVEATLKLFYVDEQDQAWLVPESRNPTHRPIKLDANNDSDEGIQIVGRVVGSFRRE